jgi:hypothetical protein
MPFFDLNANWQMCASFRVEADSLADAEIKLMDGLASGSIPRPAGSHVVASTEVDSDEFDDEEEAD